VVREAAKPALESIQSENLHFQVVGGAVESVLAWIVESKVRCVIIDNVVADWVHSRFSEVDPTEAAKELVDILLDAVPGGLTRSEVRQERIPIISPSNGHFTSEGVVCIGRICNIDGCLDILVHRTSCVGPVITILCIVPGVVRGSIRRPRNIVLGACLRHAECNNCGQDSNFGSSAALTYQHYLIKYYLF
jgi:hypothetical protein